MKCIVPVLLLGMMALAFSACAGAADQPLQDTPTATNTLVSPTATIVWFPPSETPTPQPVATIQPTPERKPDIGTLLLTDDFSSSRLWNAAASEDASIDVSRNRLTLAVQPGVYAFRVRQGPAFTNFYAEITAQPSLCRDADEYGLLFRSPTGVAYYSFAVSCNGTSRADRVRLGKPLPLHDPVPSADVPGPGGEVRLGVWVSGPEMHFFLNGHYQFSVTDGTYKSGSVGAFARAAGTTPVTVLFSNLSVYDVTYVAPSVTPAP